VIRFLVNLWLTLWLSFLTAATIQSLTPGDYQQIRGLDTAFGRATPGTPDLKERMEQSAWRRAEKLVITEAEANRYLANIVSGRQSHLTAWAAHFERVALQFEPGFCRVWFIWKSHGHVFTASLDLTVKREGSNFITEVQGGRYGRMPLLRRGVLATLVPACTSLCDCLNDEGDEKREISQLFQMNHITFEQGKMILDPRFENVK